MQLYTDSLTSYKRLDTVPVTVGDLILGGYAPIRVQTMTTFDTMDTVKTVEQSIRCIEAGAELIRITAPSKTEAENLLHIKNEIRKRGYKTPIVADIHFTPNAAEIAARIVEKVRINPGNYADKKKFDFIEYSDADYLEEIERIRVRFLPLIKICKEYGGFVKRGRDRSRPVARHLQDDNWRSGTRVDQRSEIADGCSQNKHTDCRPAGGVAALFYGRGLFRSGPTCGGLWSGWRMEGRGSDCGGFADICTDAAGVDCTGWKPVARGGTSLSRVGGGDRLPDGTGPAAEGDRLYAGRGDCGDCELPSGH